MFTIKYIRICLSVSAFLCMSSRTRVWFQLLIKAHLVCARELKTQIDTSLSLSFSFSFFSSLSLSLLHTSLGTTIYLSFNITLYEHYLYTNPLSPTLSPLQLYSHFLTLIHAFSLSLSLSHPPTETHNNNKKPSCVEPPAYLLIVALWASPATYALSLSVSLSPGWRWGQGGARVTGGDKTFSVKIELEKSSVCRATSSRKDHLENTFLKKRKILSPKKLNQPTNRSIETTLDAIFTSRTSQDFVIFFNTINN